MEKIKLLFASARIRFGILGRLFGFLWRNKMWWLIPMVFVLAAFFILIIFAQSSPLGPFIYTLF